MRCRIPGPPSTRLLDGSSVQTLGKTIKMAIEEESRKTQHAQRTESFSSRWSLALSSPSSSTSKKHRGKLTQAKGLLRLSQLRLREKQSARAARGRDLGFAEGPVGNYNFLDGTCKIGIYHQKKGSLTEEEEEEEEAPSSSLSLQTKGAPV